MHKTWRGVRVGGELLMASIELWRRIGRRVFEVKPVRREIGGSSDDDVLFSDGALWVERETE